MPTKVDKIITKAIAAVPAGQEPGKQASVNNPVGPHPSAQNQTKEKQPKIIDFDEQLSWLEQKGKTLFGAHFKIFPADYEIIFKLMVYLYRDQHHAPKYNIDFRKGLLLSGPIGCGKTSLMSLIRHLKFPGPGYQLVSSRDVCLQFMEQGHTAIRYFSSLSQKQPIIFCFDDLGTETSMKYYGNDTNVMAEILLSRYDLFTQRHTPTHLTTNLSASELEKLYGNRVRSRMREMFNLIAFPANSTDKRS